MEEEARTEQSRIALSEENRGSTKHNEPQNRREQNFIRTETEFKRDKTNLIKRFYQSRNITIKYRTENNRKRTEQRYEKRMEFYQNKTSILIST